MKNVIFWAIGIFIWFWYYQMLDSVFMKVQGLSYTEHLDMFFSAF